MGFLTSDAQSGRGSRDLGEIVAVGEGGKKEGPQWGMPMKVLSRALLLLTPKRRGGASGDSLITRLPPPPVLRDARSAPREKRKR